MRKAGEDECPVPFGPSWAQRSQPFLHGAKVGNSLSCFAQGLQQSVHTVLRVDADLLIGQVSVKLSSSQFVELPNDRIRATFTGHVHGELGLQHDCGCVGGRNGGSGGSSDTEK